MLLSEVQSWLTALPVLGPLFSGNIAIIILRLLALVATFYGGTRLLRWMWNHSVGAGKPSVRALVKAGHFEAAGDLCAREGDLAGALSHFDKASAWLKAGHTARRMGRSADAGAYYEKARDLKLAVAAYEAAGQEEQVVRLAPYMEEPSLLLRAARHWAKRSDHGQAAEFFKRARRLDEAEKHFLQTGAGGRAQAIQMYLEALEELPPDQQRGNAAHTLAGQAARLFLAGQKGPKGRSLLGRPAVVGR
jgi:tetratricopeptide (TPR) repeat protein